MAKLKKKKTKKKQGVKLLKKKAAALFQLYVRLRDSDSDGFGNCCSCGVNVHYKKAHGGHFISRGYLSTLFEEKNVHLQCARCNMMGGNASGYALFIEKTYGPKEIENLDNKKNESVKYDVAFYESLIVVLKQKTERLESEKELI